MTMPQATPQARRAPCTHLEVPAPGEEDVSPSTCRGCCEEDSWPHPVQLALHQREGAIAEMTGPSAEMRLRQEPRTAAELKLER